MNPKFVLGLLVTIGAASILTADSPIKQPTLTGDYLEVRSCDVFTGPCFANAEMGLSGKEALLVWSVRDGNWNGTQVNGLSVIAAVRTGETMGDLHYHPQNGRAVVIVDSRATAAQRVALTDLARTLSGRLLKDVVDVKTSNLEVALGTCTKAGCASVKAPGLVEITTRCMGEKDHLCGNEDNYYPPLTKVDHAMAAFSEVASYQGDGLGMTWQGAGQRNAFIGNFSR